MMVLLSGRLAASKASAWHEWKEGDGRREMERVVDHQRIDLEVEKMRRSREVEVEKMAKEAAELEVKRIASAHEVEKKTWLDRCKALEADRAVPAAALAAAPRPRSPRLR